jgi:hypothetical protein
LEAIGSCGLAAVLLAAACGSGNASHGPRPASGGAGGSGAGGGAGQSSTGGSSTGTGGGVNTGGAGGVSTAGGTSGAGTVGTDAGASGAGGASTSPDAGAPSPCAFEIDAAPSPMIPTVGVVNWTVNLPDLSEARIDFTLDDPAPGTINVGSGGEISVDGTMHRALMLGMKGQHTYTYRITAKGGSTTCTSPDQSFTTGDASDAPTVQRTVMSATGQARGFIVTSGGYEAAPTWQDAYIIDSDGDIVWWFPSPASCSRALMDWEGQNIWMLTSNPPLGGTTNNTGGAVVSVAMDGSGRQAMTTDSYLFAHHDLAVLPGGVVALLIGERSTDTKSDLVERSPDGTLKTIVALDDQIFGSTGGFHANSIMYQVSDDTYTVSDLIADAIVKISRTGQLLWQFRKDCKGSVAKKCLANKVVVDPHGHHLMANGDFLFFSSLSITMSPVYEFMLTETATTLTGNQLWTYTADNSVGSDILGDIQRLPNGNTLIDYCHHGEMRELSPSGDVIQILDATSPRPTSSPGYYSFGYFNFRETLYGPPLR